MSISMEITRLSLSSSRIAKAERVLILSDLHEQARQEWTTLWLSTEPSLVVIPGDWLEAHSRRESGHRMALEAVRTLAEQCPVYYSLGNHEMGTRGNRPPCDGADDDVPLSETTQRLCEQMTEQGAVLLHNRCVQHGSLCIGGLTSAGGHRISHTILDDMARAEGFRLLLCHHPEYYPRYVQCCDIDLTVSGHAHGGQWRLLGQGLYAPGQGLFPRYTGGFYDDDRLLVSRGLAGRYPVPRIGNRRQSILLELLPKS